MKKLTLTVMALACGLSAAFAEEQTRLPIPYNPDGTIDLPQNYRQWVNVGTTLLPKGDVNIIDNLPVAAAEYIDTYVEPQTFAIYMDTGIWPDGAQIAKEFTATKGVEDGEVVVESHYTGLSLIIKDAERFPAETGNLGYFQFGHHPEPYEATASLMPRDRCSACHEASASHQQYIFADHHLGLTRN